MKHTALTTVVVLIVGWVLHLGAVRAQDVQLHYFNFNADAPASSVNWPQPVAATIGSGTLVYTFEQAVSFGGTTINGNEGEENGGSFCPQGGAENVNNGKHLDLLLPTTGHHSIVVTYPTRRTSTGFTTHAVYYTVDGEEWLEFDVFDISGYATTGAAHQRSPFDLADLAAVNDTPAFASRVVLTGVTSSAGNNRFDNISVRGLELGGNTGINQPEELRMQVYPNPAYNILYVYAGFAVDRLSLVDMQGRMVYEARPETQGSLETGIDVSGLPAGMYVLRAVSDKHQYARKVFIGER